MRGFNPFIVPLTMAAWFAVSNHCALGALESSKTAAGANTCCHGTARVPGKTPGRGEETPCCKTLRALAIKPAVSLSRAFAGAYKPFAYPTVAKNIMPDRIARQLRPLETGPPGRVTFAELVLQRSLLAHAPPSLV